MQALASRCAVAAAMFSAAGCFPEPIDTTGAGGDGTTGPGGSTTSSGGSTTSSNFGGIGGGGGVPTSTTTTEACDPVQCQQMANQCQSAACAGDTCDVSDLAAGTRCDDGGNVCDGAGTCVECVDAGDCSSPEECDGNVCKQPLCLNGMKDPGETDDDCGGETCPPCANGKACEVPGDCALGSCIGTVCCTPDDAAACMNQECGDAANNCGQMVTCGSCLLPEVCQGNSCVCLPDPAPMTCSGKCGAVTNNCGDSIDCGGCGAGQCCENSCADLLGDPNNCGACGHSCAGDPCVAGKCQPTIVASGQTNVVGIALDSERIYWTLYGSNGAGYTDGGVRRSLKTPQSPVECVPAGATPCTNFTGPQPIAVHPTDAPAADVYWTNFYPPYTVARYSVGVSPVSTLVSGISAPRDLAVDAEHVYFLTLDAVHKVNRFTGEYVVGLVAGGFAYVAGSANQGIAIDQTYIYFTDSAANGGVYRLLKTGEPPTKIFPLANAHTIAVAGNSLCFAKYTAAGAVYCTDLGGENLKELASNQPYPIGVHNDGGYCYWATANGPNSHVYRRKVDMSQPVETLSVGLENNVGDLAIDATHVYYTVNGAGLIKRVAK